MASLRLNLIHEQGEPICEHSLYAGVQRINGKFCLESSGWKAVVKQKLFFWGSDRSHFCNAVFSPWL